MTTAQITGRIAGTAYAHTRRAVALIDWQEVAAIVLHGLQVLIVLTLLAGRATRQVWDALPVLSERLGRWYAQLLVPQAIALPPVQHPLMALAAELEALTCRELRTMTGVSRKVAKRHLIEYAVAMA